MKAPDTFKFYHVKSNSLYTARVSFFSQNEYDISWEDGSTEYLRSDVERCLEKGIWKIVGPKNNKQAVHFLEKNW